MTARIVTLPARRALSLSLDDLVGFEGVKLLAKLIQQWIDRGRRKLKDLATAAQLTPRTVAKIMTRETRSPRMLTCIMLFKALGFRAVRLE